MNFLCQPLSTQIRRRCHHHQLRSLYDAVSSLKCPRDRGLDHAVERERHLKPLLNLKNLIISEPSKSIPLALITESRETLGIPFRPIEFIRKYPSIFQEFYPGSLNIQPHIKLAPEIISLNSEENLIYQRVDYKQEVARRLLKLLMIGRINKIPILLLERLKWELGLPPDYEKDVIPDFPDYFRVVNKKSLGESEKILELVCWTEEFAVSEMEKKGAKDGKTQFLLKYSTGFEMDKKYKKWVDEWQKLPYISPYENAMHLAAKTDESDKWAVSVLHELLNIFVGKKAERDSLLYLGEYLGLRSRFKLAFLHHPGIFYLSSKIGTHTVVLREGYKRGALIERHPLMDMRFKYVQLMNMVPDDEKSKSPKKRNDEGKKGSEGEEVNSTEEDNAEMSESSDEDEDDYDDGFEGENSRKRRGFRRRDEIVEGRDSRRNVSRRFNRRTEEKGNYKRVEDNAEMSESSDEDEDDYDDRFEGENSRKRGGFKRRDEIVEERDSRRNVSRRFNRRTEEKGNFKRFEGGDGSKRGGGFRGKGENFEVNNSRRNVMRRASGRRDDDSNCRGSDVENAGGRGKFKRNGENFDNQNYGRNLTRRPNGRINGDGNGKYRGFEGENTGKRGGFRMKGENFEGKNYRRNVSRRENGRNNDENMHKSSTRFSGRTNAPKLRTQKSDFSRNNAGI
ncbi:Ubiquitin carboxyl-terminal hydrolase family protein [Striga hermonthica]|uniref:Ubiquitin carboxyl-terminal hydrolase family protein n=1 Tax=Striga hermonthica TaxID=68872 RepID=A0A9N7RFJ8_STRHE|nr:Ubiquitin carboxyl-terminal hydrolase family protein [Striga hermonthica]